MLLFLPLLTLALAQIPPEARTIVDVLSETGQFTILLKHLQRHGLIPFLNTQRDVTFVAPDNGAFALYDGQVTREQLLYHVLKGSVTYENGTDGTSVFLTALDHVPVKVDVSHNKGTMEVNGVQMVECDQIAGRQRGVIQVPEFVLEVPGTWQQEIGDIHNLSHFSRLAQSADFPDISNMTLLAPADSAMLAAFPPLLDDYLTSEAGKNDLNKIISHFVVDKLVVEGDDEVTTLDGSKLTVGDGLTVNGTWKPLQSQIPCKNGLVHVYESLLSEEPHLLEFTPRMALQGLHLNRFVALLELAGLSKLIENVDIQQTIFAPVEKPNAFFSKDSLESYSSGLYSEGGAYHFSKSELVLSRELFLNKPHVLVDTKMKSKKLGRRSQRIKLSYDEVNDEFLVNDRRVVSSLKYDTSMFVVGNSLIYLIDEEMDPPSGLASSVAPIFHTSRSLFYLNELGRLKLPLNYDGWTVVLPTTDAWNELGITTEYLTSNKTALSLLFDSLIFHTPFYSDSEPTELETFTKESNVTIRWLPGDSNSRDRIEVDSKIYNVNQNEYDILFNSGVVHTVDSVYIPPTLDITASQLIEAANPHFLPLLDAANLTYTLNPDLGFSFMVPSQESIKAENISVHSPDIREYMELHVVCNNTLGEGGSASTLRSGVSLISKRFSDKLLMVSIFQGIDREARILSRGIASNNATVFNIDRPLNPSWVIPENPWFPSHDHLRTPVAIFIGIIIGLVAFFAILSCLLWVFLGKSPREVDPEQGSRPPLAHKHKPKSRTDILRAEAGATTPLLAGGSGPKYSTAPISVTEPRKNGRGLKIGPTR